MSPRMHLDLPTILEAATELADRHGLQAVTLAALAETLQVRPPSLYNHVSGLADLRKQLAIYGLDRLHQMMTIEAVGRSGDEAIRALARAYITFARSHPGLYEAALASPDLCDPAVQRAGQSIVELLVRVLRAYDLDKKSALHAVRGLRSLLHGFASLEMRGGFQLPLDREESLRLLIDTFLAGMRALYKRPKRSRRNECR